ncbi:MAG: hypothetical protein NXI08_11565 [bacterium]|nr:hypothetical protein [bacterium]
MKFNKHLDKIVFYPLAFGIVLLFIGIIIDLRSLMIIGTIGLLPLAIIIFLGFLGLVMETLESILPDFIGKEIFVYILTLIFALMFILILIFGGFSESSQEPCQFYRGYPTC